MLARVLSAAVNGIEAFPVEVEVNCGWGDTIIVLIMSISPMLRLGFFALEYWQIQASLRVRHAEMRGASQNISTNCRSLAIECGGKCARLQAGPTAIRSALMAGNPARYERR
jgi:hypothetical protein